MGDLLVTKHYTKVKYMADLVDNNDSLIPEENIVIYVINALSQRSNYVVRISHRSPPLSFL